MDIISTVFQVLTAVGIYNVWLLRTQKQTPYRGKNANSLKEEFAAYGLSEPVFYLVGTLKLFAATALLIGVWVPSLVTPAAALMVILMSGALAMHVKVNDPMIRSLPASFMLFMSLVLLF